MKRSSRASRALSILFSFVLATSLLPGAATPAQSLPEAPSVSDATDAQADAASNPSQATDASEPDELTDPAATPDPDQPAAEKSAPEAEGGTGTDVPDAPQANDPAAPSLASDLDEPGIQPAAATGALASALDPTATPAPIAPQALGATPAEADADHPEDTGALSVQATAPIVEGETVTISRAGTDSWSAAPGTKNTITLADNALYRFTVIGGRGGGSADGSVPGGVGGTARAVSPMSPRTLYGVAGGQGQTGTGGDGAVTPTVGGANGGGSGGTGNWRRGRLCTSGGAGGGASHLAAAEGSTADLTDSQLALVAGGGGGACWNYSGGAGGGASGGNGTANSGAAPTGGTQTSGYRRGVGMDGIAGTNGATNGAEGKGGGGGGYWGGFARDWGGGHSDASAGAGSGFLGEGFFQGQKADAGSIVRDGITVATTTSGGGLGEGQVTVEYLASIIALDDQGADTPASNSTIYAAPKADLYYDDYYSVDGLGMTIDSIDVPTKAGWTFTGYFTERNGQGTKCIDRDGTFVPGAYQVGTTTLYASWKLAVTFDDNGTGVAMPETQELDSGAFATKPDDPASSIGDFLGWSTDHYSFQAFDFSTPITAETTLYAFWVPNVTFAMQGHGDPVAPQFVTRGTPATRPEDPSATGYTFEGWFVSDDPGETRQFDFSTPIDASTRVFARWAANRYTVRFLNGGEQVGTQDFVYGDPETPLTTAAELSLERPGWRFAGWRAHDSLQVDYTDGQAVHNLSTETGFVDFHAVWVRDLTFVSGEEPAADSLAASQDQPASGRSVQTVPQLSDVISYASVTAPDLAPVDGWAELGWTQGGDAAAAPEFSAGDVITPQTDVTFYGLYDRDVTLSFDGNGADDGFVDELVATQHMNAYGSLDSASFVLPENGFSRIGWRFAGWDLGRPGDTVTLALKPSDSASLTCTAQWSGPYEYVIAYDANGGSGAMGVQVVPEHVQTQLSPNGFTRDGFEFVGWNTKADGTGTSFQDGELLVDLADPNETVTLYAQWSALPPREAPAGNDPSGASTTPTPGTGDPLARTAGACTLLLAAATPTLALAGRRKRAGR